MVSVFAGANTFDGSIAVSVSPAAGQRKGRKMTKISKLGIGPQTQ